MKPVYAPNYYHRFKCKADKCRHSCCVGWEIDIDPASLAWYDRIKGDLGLRLRDNIDRENDPPCFILTKEERCPFLLKNGLCELITELGEERLCQICADHPRFRHVLGDRVELGLGLCCEAVAELLLTQEEGVELVALPSEAALRERFADEPRRIPEPSAIELLETRDRLLSILLDRSQTLSERISRIFLQCHINLSEHHSPLFPSFQELADILWGMERLDPSWDACLRALERLTEDPNVELEGETHPVYEHLIGYFLLRYLTPDSSALQASLRTTVAFAVLCTIVIHAIHRSQGGGEHDGLCEILRMFSGEIEYSEENLDRLIDEVDTMIS